jgi:putative ABC transport system ATP-binding protein
MARDREVDIGRLRSAVDTLLRGRSRSRAEGEGAPGRAVLDIPPIIRLEDVHKRYGEGPASVEALRGVDLDIPRGAFTVLLGPSGSGKTTLLNLVGGLEQPTQGRLTVDGNALGELEPSELSNFRREHIGFVFQFFNLVPTLTALENVQLVAELVNAGAAEAEAALAAVGLGDRSDHFPGALSGGEQQRVAVARAVVKSPPLLLCDEPTGSLDLETGRQVLASLRELNRSRQITVLLVTHSQAIGAMADLVVHLGSGPVTEIQANAEPVGAEVVSW